MKSIPINSYIQKKFGQLYTIARFDPIQNNWTKLGDLNRPRMGHAVIQVDNELIVVGGLDHSTKPNTQIPVPTESCKFNGHDSMTCTMREPQLKFHGFYAELSLNLGELFL